MQCFAFLGLFSIPFGVTKIDGLAKTSGSLMFSVLFVFFFFFFAKAQAGRLPQDACDAHGPAQQEARRERRSSALDASAAKEMGTPLQSRATGLSKHSVLSSIFFVFFLGKDNQDRYLTAQQVL